jgi:prephenate dehydratase
MLNFFAAIITSYEGGFGSFAEVFHHLGKAKFSVIAELQLPITSKILAQNNKNS